MKRLVAGLALIVLTALPSSAASAMPVHGVFHDVKHNIGHGTSSNWSGYDVTGSGATSVTGTWTQAAAKCAPGETSWSSPWVGLDGDTSNTVEQTGTDTDCQNGSPYYYAWYEMYPKGTIVIPTSMITVSPGDVFTGTVTAQGGGTFVLTLENMHTHKTFTTTQSSRKAGLSSAEWIVEGPSRGTLTNFNSVSFSNASGTINNKTANLGSLSPLNPITMVTSGGLARATPSDVSTVSGVSSFSVTWNRS